MPWTEIINDLAQEAILLDPGNLQGCGKILKLLEKLDQPEISVQKEQLKEKMEAMILKELGAEPPSMDSISKLVEEIQKILKSNYSDEGISIEIDEDILAEKDNKEGNGSGNSEVTSADIPMDEILIMPDEPENIHVSDDIQVPAENTEINVNDTEVSEEDTQISQDEEAAINYETPASVAQETVPEVKKEEPSEFIIEDASLLRDFISEANEHLNSIEVNLVEWEKSPSDKEIINSIFRPFHTIKGVAGFLNLKEINRTAHQLENLLDEAREGRLKLSPALSDLIFDGVDILKSMISVTERALDSGEFQGYGHIDIENLFKRISMFLNIAKKGGAEEEVYIENKPPLGEILVKDGKVSKEEIDHILDKQAGLETPKPIGEMLVEENVITRRDVRDAVRKQTDISQATEKFLKVDTLKMDQLLDMVGELVISQSMVTHNPEVLKISEQRFSHDLSQLGRVTKALQIIAMSMRLVPIGATFQKMSRIVRDLARKSGKEINLVLEGQSAEIDRNMVEELYDPLVHMIRNSCDHGIKTPEERKAAGKSPEGTIILKAEHAGGKIVITINDDGDGLNKDAILSKALEKGIIQPGEILEDNEIFKLIFMAGFSTAKQITDVSGRGVGMDVVRKAIEKLHGNIEVYSEKGKGSSFVIKLPLTTAIIDGLMVQVGDNRYIIPTLSVRQIVRTTKENITTVLGKGETVMVRGKLLPILRLHNVLNLKGAIENTEEAVLVIVDDNGREVALQVDALLGKQEVVIKSLGEKFRNSKGLAGGAILGDGKVGLILDIASIVNFDGVSM